MKKSIQRNFIFTAGICLLLFYTPVIYAQDEYPLGDATRDGVVDIVDALIIAQWVCGLGTPYSLQDEADVNMDGTINILDGLLVLRYVTGHIPQLPASLPPAPEGTPLPGAGELLITPDTYEATIIFSPLDPYHPRIADTLVSSIMVNTGNQELAAYSMDILHDHNLFCYDDSVGSSGIVAGEDGFYTAVNGCATGTFSVAAIDENGIGPGDALHLIDMHLIPIDEGASEITIRINNLVDENTYTVGNPSANTLQVDIDKCTMGDINNDSTVDIIDALLVARYYVGLNPVLLKYACADVNRDGYITIVDALLIARFYVGLIEDFEYE